MAIKGVTDQFKTPLDLTPRGKPIRIGYLGKGRREGFGKNIKLYDEDYFVFTAAKDGREGEQIEKAFRDAYGEKPDVIGDVRISAQLAGNFDINDCAWLFASKHTERGSTFLGQSDGENIKRLRNEKTGRVDFFYDGEMPHRDITQKDETQYGSITYKGKPYPWQRRFQVDLILPEFNKILYARGLSGAGVVTLGTTAAYDIPTLIQEYFGILHQLASVFSNPMSGDYERVIQHIPLRNIPLRLFRSVDKTTTPNYKTKDAGDRLNTTHSLLHWQLSPDFSAAAQIALDQRTQLTLAAIANKPLLQESNDMTLVELNNQLFDSGTQQALPEPKAQTNTEQLGPDWDEFDDTDEGEFVEAEPQPDEPKYQQFGFAVGDAVMVKGDGDEKAGVVAGFTSTMVRVSVAGSQFNTKPERLVLAP